MDIFIWTNETDSLVLNQTKGQEEIKAIIERSLKSLAEQMSHVSKKEKLQDVYLAVSALPQLIEASLQNVQNDLRNITKEMQARTIWQLIMLKTWTCSKLLIFKVRYVLFLQCKDFLKPSYFFTTIVTQMTVNQWCFANEYLQEISCNLKSVNQKDLVPTSLSSKVLYLYYWTINIICWVFF